MSSLVLANIQSTIVFYGYPTFMSIGYIGSVFIIIVFIRQPRSTCSVFLISSTIASLFYLSFNSFVQLFPFYYRDGTLRALILCKLRFYFGNTLGQLARMLFVAAVLDRFFYTSNRASFRAFSRLKYVKWWILGICIFWPLFASHLLVMITIVNGQCSAFGVYATVYASYVLFVGFFPSTLVAIFGYLTYRHVSQATHRIHPIGSNTNQTKINNRRRDRTLLVVVLSESIAYFITTTPYSIVYFEMFISRYVLPDKSALFAQIESFTLAMTFLLLYINNAIPFYVFLITSKSFRQDVKQLFIDIYRKLTR